MRILFHFDPSPAVRARLDALVGTEFAVNVCPEHDDTRFNALLSNAEVLWHVLKPVTAGVIAAAPKLRLIQKFGVGVNTIDLDAARARGISVCNIPGANSRAVAELTLTLMLAALRRVAYLHTRLREQDGWHVPNAVQDRLSELGGKTVGLVGFGAVPRLLAPWLTAIGARVVYHSRTKREVPYPCLTMAELLAESDILSLHVPLTAETRNILDASAFARMKRGVVLVNTARGNLVAEEALVHALHEGIVGAAGLDVFGLEPVDSAHPLLAFEQVVTTPHVAWLTAETMERCLSGALANCRALRDRRPLANVVL